MSDARLSEALRKVIVSAKYGASWPQLEQALDELAGDPAANLEFRCECAYNRMILAKGLERPRAELEQIFVEIAPTFEAASLAYLARATASFAASDHDLAARYLPPLRERLDAALAAPDAPDREELTRLRDDIARILARHGVANGDDGEAP